MNRNSNYELLRVLCIWGILHMHTFGIMFSTVSGCNLVYGVFINSIFNMGVSLFMLISGYWGIHFDFQKIVRIECLVVFFSLISFLWSLSTLGFSWNGLITAITPIIHRTYWYMSIYILMIVFSPFINKIPEVLSKVQFEILLILLFLFLSVVPTIFMINYVDQGGKGFPNMLLIYLCGRYIRKYGMEKVAKMSVFKLIIVASCCIILGFVLNLIESYRCGGVGLNVPYARDCSVIIVIGSICVFLIFSKMNIQNKTINKLAASVFTTYLMEGMIRNILDRFIDISIYQERWYLGVIILLYTMTILLLCFIIDQIRIHTFGKLERYIIMLLNKCFDKAKTEVLSYLNR